MLSVVFVGMGGDSLMYTVRGEADVPVMLVPNIVREYEVFL